MSGSRAIVWPVRVIITGRALTIGLAYYAVTRLTSPSVSFVAILGGVLTFDTFVALESRRFPLVGVVRATRTTLPRAWATAQSLFVGLLVGAGFGALVHLGLPRAVAAVATAGFVYSLAEQTPNNISAFIALLGGLGVFERVAALSLLGPRTLLPATLPVAWDSLVAGATALAIGLGSGALMGFLTRLLLPRAFRSRRSLAYPEE
ncbi:MAG: hypothetical protein ACM3RP_00590 [Chitinophagales bacterium]